MRAFTRLGPEILVQSVTESLTKLGYSYARNQGQYVTEFEVRSPSHFLVVVEDLTRIQMGYPLRSRVRVESAVALRRTVGAADDEEELKRSVAAFAREFRAVLPGEPWKGVGVVRSKSEKTNWESLDEV